MTGAGAAAHRSTTARRRGRGHRQDGVGPDEPWGDQTREAVEEAHWNSLQHKLEDAGVDVEDAELRTLPHDVEVSERLRRRLVDSAPG
jgi:hypothetical protein